MKNNWRQKFHLEPESAFSTDTIKFTSSIRRKVPSAKGKSVGDIGEVRTCSTGNLREPYFSPTFRKTEAVFIPVADL